MDVSEVGCFSIQKSENIMSYQPDAYCWLSEGGLFWHYQECSLANYPNIAEQCGNLNYDNGVYGTVGNML